MKLIIKTSKRNYVVRLPNYFDTAKIDAVVSEAKMDMHKDETIVSHVVYGDSSLTIEERSEMDLYGKVVNPLVELTVDTTVL